MSGNSWPWTQQATVLPMRLLREAILQRGTLWEGVPGCRWQREFDLPNSGQSLKWTTSHCDNKTDRGIPGGSGVKNPLASAEDLGSIPDLGGSHTPQSSWSPCSTTTEPDLEPTTSEGSVSNKRSHGNQTHLSWGRARAAAKTQHSHKYLHK